MPSSMQKIEAIIRPERLQEVQDALDELGVSGLNVTEVMGCGRQKGYTEQYRGSRANISLLPKLKVESVVSGDIVDKAVDAIVAAAYTGETGGGRQPAGGAWGVVPGGRPPPAASRSRCLSSSSGAWAISTSTGWGSARA